MLMPVDAALLRIAERVGPKALRHGRGNEMLMAPAGLRPAADLGLAAKASG